jgi:hypothetical protein
VSIDDTKDKIEASGFSPTGNRTYVQGQREQTVTIGFRMDWATGGPFLTLKALYEGGSVFPFFVQPDSDAGTSSTNQIYGGSASVYGLPVEASLNEVEEFEVEFSPSSNASFSWGTVAP